MNNDFDKLRITNFNRIRGVLLSDSPSMSEKGDDLNLLAAVITVSYHLDVPQTPVSDPELYYVKTIRSQVLDGLVKLNEVETFSIEESSRMITSIWHARYQRANPDTSTGAAIGRMLVEILGSAIDSPDTYNLNTKNAILDVFKAKLFD